MGIFIKRGYPHSEEEMEALISTLPGFVGIGHHELTSVEALRNSDVFTAIMMIASDLAKMDIHVKQDNRREPYHMVDRLLNKRPNQVYNAYVFKLIVVANALLTKHGYVEIIRDKTGRPIELYHLKTSEVELKSNERHFYYLYQNKRKISYTDVIDYKPYSLDGVGGLSMLESLAPDIDMQQNSKSFFSNFFKQGTQAGGLLKLKNAQLSKEAREVVRKEFQDAYSGAQHAGKVLVLDETMEYDRFEIDTEILKLINSSEHSTAQVAKVFGIPLHKFGIQASNMSLKDSMADYLQSTLSRYMQGIVSEFEFKLFPDSDRTLDFDAETYRKADWDSYVQTVRNQYQDGAITLNEYREKLGHAPVDADYANKHRVSLNQVNAELVDSYQLNMADNRLKTNGEGGEENSDESRD